MPLEPHEVDLDALILARNDTHPDGDWWFDPRSGESLYYGLDDTSERPALAEGVHVLIPTEPQPRQDVDDFLAEAENRGVSPETVARLAGAYHAKGGLRRFRNLVGRTDAAGAYAAFVGERERARALSWLRSRGLVVES